MGLDRIVVEKGDNVIIGRGTEVVAEEERTSILSSNPLQSQYLIPHLNPLSPLTITHILPPPLTAVHLMI